MTANEKRQSFQKIIFSSSNCTFVASFQCYMLYALLVFLKSWIAAYSRVPAFGYLHLSSFNCRQTIDRSTKILTDNRENQTAIICRIRQIIWLLFEKLFIDENYPVFSCHFYIRILGSREQVAEIILQNRENEYNMKSLPMQLSNKIIIFTYNSI